MSNRILLVTCNRWPELSASDQLYADALAARGCTVQLAPWNGPLTPFRDTDAIVLRAAWDYADDPSGFLAWLGEVDCSDIPLFNSAFLVRWNADKRYLLDLAAAPIDVTVPALRLVTDAAGVKVALTESGWERAVIKPVIGQSGHGVRLVTPDAPSDLDGIAADGRTLIVQEFVPEVQTGELAFVFLDGAFSHAFARVPAAGEFRINSQYGGRVEPAAVAADAVAQARAVLDALPEMPLYARVDGVLRDDRLLLMELELIEPGLALTVDPSAADRFAAATLRRLGW